MFNRCVAGTGRRPVSSIPAISNQTLLMAVTYLEPVTGVPVSPLLFPVKMAFVPRNTVPVTLDWKVSAWEAEPDDEGQWWASIEVGPGSTVATVKGVWQLWMQITMPTETPVIPGPHVIVT